jgi:sec-independent protein translocase protein TatC
MTDIDKYFNFVLTMFIVFGITFEIPVAVVLLVKMNVVSVEKLVEARPYVIVGAFVLAAIVTPPDVVSQLLLAFPLWLLYELGIFVARLLVKARPAEDEYATLPDAPADGQPKKD